MSLKDRRFREFAFFYSIMLGCGITSLGKRLRERARELGYEIRFRRDRIILANRDGELWLPLTKAPELWGEMHAIKQLAPRFIFEQRKNRQVSDLRGNQRFRMPGREDHIWLCGLPETADVTAGYLYKGGPPEGSVAFDCGAYCGEVSLALARRVGASGRVFAFEPDVRNRTLLDRNISEAGLTNISVVEKGLWKDSRTLKFVAAGNYGSRISEAEGDVVTSQVPVISFEEACRTAGAVPSFVKMDIEGAEVEAIEGSLDFIAAHSIRFAIASYHDRDGQPTSALLEPLFQKAGYHVETGYPEHRTTWAWKA